MSFSFKGLTQKEKRKNEFNRNSLPEYLLLSIHIIWFYTVQPRIYLRRDIPITMKELSLSVGKIYKDALMYHWKKVNNRSGCCSVGAVYLWNLNF
jgi:hypothetical protein